MHTMAERHTQTCTSTYALETGMYSDREMKFPSYLLVHDNILPRLETLCFCTVKPDIYAYWPKISFYKCTRTSLFVIQFLTNSL